MPFSVIAEFGHEETHFPQFMQDLISYSFSSVGAFVRIVPIKTKLPYALSRYKEFFPIVPSPLFAIASFSLIGE